MKRTTWQSKPLISVKYNKSNEPEEDQGEAMADTKDNKEIIVTEFNDAAAIKFREKVLAHAEKDPMEPIIIYISSYGGFVDALASMVETIQTVPNKIITVCLGHAMSCGAILFSFGDYRFIGRHSRLMIHEVSGGAIGDTHDVNNDAGHLKELNSYWMEQLALNCGFKDYDDLRDFIKTRDGRNIWLNAQEAVDFGIADFVGTPRLETAVGHRIYVNSEKPKEARRVSKFSKQKPKKQSKSKKTNKSSPKSKRAKATATDSKKPQNTSSVNNAPSGSQEA